MKFAYKKETNLRMGQKFYGIIEVSRCTYDGVHPIYVDDIDYNNEEIIFRVDQPCRYVSCRFDEMEYLVFETEEEANDAELDIEFGMGLYAYEY